MLTAASEAFVARQGIDARAAQKLGDLSAEKQERAVWDESRSDIKNPSAFLSKRCRVVEQEQEAHEGSEAPANEPATEADYSECGGGDPQTAAFCDGDRLEDPQIAIPEGSSTEIAQFFGLNCENGHDDDWPDEDKEGCREGHDDEWPDDGHEDYGKGYDDEWPDEGCENGYDDDWPDEGNEEFNEEECDEGHKEDDWPDGDQEEEYGEEDWDEGNWQ